MGRSNYSKLQKQNFSASGRLYFPKTGIAINENCKVESIESVDGIIHVKTIHGEHYTSASVLLAIGRRGTPRKLNVPGETMEKVAYRLLEPEEISGKHVIIVGGGDSAIESALLLSGNNHVILSYRGEVFNRIKPQNSQALNKAVAEGKLEVKMNSNLINIEDEFVTLTVQNMPAEIKLKNDLVYIFAGGELPTQFLEKAGIKITKKFGEIVRKH